MPVSKLQALPRSHSELDSPARAFPPPCAAYLHIPFCRRRCYYCDFATGGGTAELIEQYVQHLCGQIRQLPASYPLLDTVFFGGGTPSLLAPAQLQRIFEDLDRRVGFAANAEISLEANPGTVTQASLEGHRTAGVNRISLGVQAFQPELLAACGRMHDVEAVYRAVADLRAAGFTNFNLDLIFGLPHQTKAHWRESLAEVVAIAPAHVSLYDLTIESGTRFGRWYRPGDTPLPSEAETVEMYHEAIATLTAAGYEHYEISNFARPGYQCRHNRIYWENRSYHGLGMGATGYVGGRRYQQPDTLAAYFKLVDSGRWPTAPIATPAEQLADTLMLGLRLREGLDVAELETRFGPKAIASILAVLAPFGDLGWVEVSRRDAGGDRLRLVPPEGWLFSNSILVDLLGAIDLEAIDADTALLATGSPLID